MRLTIACPAAHTDNANQLAMVLGYSEADGLTYRGLSWQDAQGNLYALASLPVGNNFVSAATSPLARPEWDADEVIDMDKASQAQSLVVFWQPTEESPDAPLATPDAITAVAGDDAVGMIAAMGLTAAPSEEEDS